MRVGFQGLQSRSVAEMKNFARLLAFAILPPMIEKKIIPKALCPKEITRFG
jgi:hypothetical protein